MHLNLSGPDKIRLKMLFLKSKFTKRSIKNYLTFYLQKFPEADKRKVRDVWNLKTADETIVRNLESIYRTLSKPKGFDFISVKVGDTSLLVRVDSDKDWDQVFLHDTEEDISDLVENSNLHEKINSAVAEHDPAPECMDYDKTQ